jgi:hypothetical protein
MFTGQGGSTHLNTWALFTSLVLVALFTAPILLRASFAALFGSIAALFVLVTVVSLILASRDALTTFSLIPSSSRSGPALPRDVCHEYVVEAEDRAFDAWHGQPPGSLREHGRAAGQRA